MADEKKPSKPRPFTHSEVDSFRLERMEKQRRQWLWSVVKVVATWVGATVSVLWASVEAALKIVDWFTR